jgi:3-phenylpropionate/cinnamic acid dioxygenase small subunit
MPEGDFNEDLEFGIESSLNNNKKGQRPNRSATIYNKKKA